MKYAGTDKMSDLICENYNLLLVMSRFGISLGFGDQTVEQVCVQQGVHTGTFLAVVNFMDDECCVPDDFRKELSIEALMEYLRRAHSYFLDFKLKAIREKLEDAFVCPEDEVARLIMKFYDAYVHEVEEGELSEVFNIGVFVRKHNQIETKLTELKNILVKYYPVKANNNLLNSVLFDIYACEKDLCSHCHVEDYMFVPLIMELEKKVHDYARGLCFKGCDC